MPQNIAEFRIIGRIGKITAREKVTYVSVAANYNRRDGDDWKTDTLWNSVVCFSNVGPKSKQPGRVIWCMSPAGSARATTAKATRFPTAPS